MTDPSTDSGSTSVWPDIAWFQDSITRMRESLLAMNEPLALMYEGVWKLRIIFLDFGPPRPWKTHTPGRYRQRRR